MEVDKGQCASREANVWGFSLHVRDEGGLDQGAVMGLERSRGIRGVLLEVEWLTLGDGLDVGAEGEGGIKRPVWAAV